MPTKKKTTTTKAEIKKADNKKAETIKEIYASGEEIVLPTKTLNWLAVVIVALVAGAAAGWFGGWWQAQINGLVINNEVKDNNVSSIIDLANNQNDKLKKSFDQVTLDNLATQTVGIYLAPAGGSPLQEIYKESNLVGQALVITSDGWLLTNDSVLTNDPDKYLIITSSRAGYGIDQVVRDAFSHLVFIKIDADKLNPIAISRADNIEYNDDLISMRQNVRYNQPDINYIRLTNKHFVAWQEAADFLHTTDINDVYLKLNQVLAANNDGSMLATQAGEVIGMLYQGDDAGIIRAVPGFYLQLAVSNFLSDQTRVNHNSLGVSYIDLAETVGLPQSMHQGYNRGSLLFGTDGQPAVEKDSVADKAKLVAGDIIIAVNDQELNAATGLTRLLQEYPLGATVTLTVVHEDNSTEDIIVTLTAQE
ncbi:MAG: PDZ domain-containing protein [Candidatus Komeilibacteria bacterium]